MALGCGSCPPQAAIKVIRSPTPRVLSKSMLMLPKRTDGQRDRKRHLRACEHVDAVDAHNAAATTVPAGNMRANHSDGGDAKR
jgi:hypothetical protein